MIKIEAQRDMDQRDHSSLTGEESEDSLFERFIRQHDKDAHALLYQRLKPGLLDFLKKAFSSLDEATHADIVHDVFLKLYETPETFWKPNRNRVPKVFSILSTAVANKARDILRRERKKTSLDENVLIDTAGEWEAVTRLEDLDRNRAEFKTRQTPSAAEMEKLLREFGQLTQKDEPLLEDLKNPDIWPDDEGKPDFLELAKRHGTTVNNIQQRVSRLRRSILKRHGGKLGFLTAASRIIAWIKSQIWRRGRVVFAGSLVILALLIWWELWTSTTKRITLATVNPTGQGNVPQSTSQIPPNNQVITQTAPQTVLTNNGSNQAEIMTDGIPFEVIVSFWGVNESTKAKITAVLKRSINKCSTKDIPVPAISNGLDDAGEINYNKQSAKDMRACAEYVLKLIRQADPDYTKQIFLMDRKPGLVDESTWKNAKRTIWVFLTP